MAFLAILLIIFEVLFVICAFKESSVTGAYKAFGVYSRIKAYLAFNLTLSGVLIMLMPIVPLLIPEPAQDVSGIGSVFLYLIGGAICLAIAIMLYWTSLVKCPPMLKDRCIISMVISGMGITVKIGVFFLGFVWKLGGPQEMVDESGNTVYVFGNDVYSAGGEKIGVVTDNGRSFVASAEDAASRRAARCRPKVQHTLDRKAAEESCLSSAAFHIGKVRHTGPSKI